MKKVIFTLALALGITIAASAQNYNSAIGLRLGYPFSLTYKHFISEQGAIEGILGFRSFNAYSWVNVGALYEHHWDISSVDGLSWYAGGGLGLYFWNYDDGFLDNSETTSISILGALGLDYKFENAPFNISADWLPALFVNGYDKGFGVRYGGLSLRYTLN